MGNQSSRTGRTREQEREVLAESLAAALAGPRRPELPQTVRDLIEARDRNMRGLTRTPGTLGAAIYERFTARIIDELERCGISA